MFTTQGGVEIEQVAEENPDALVRLHVDPSEGFQPWVARRLIYGAKVEDPSEQKQIAVIVERLYRAFVEFDAMLCEINPLIVTPDGEVKALDSKFTVDDNALFRHPDIAEMRDTAAADPLETFAREKGVTYVKLDGTVGICGNGAGLSMSTVDVVAHVGGRPANFCDLGGGGSAEGVVDALEVITRDPQVKSIFFNIFGGITRCDEVARGILEALDRLDMSTYPIVVRLDGTNAVEGRQILADAGQAEHPSRGDDARGRAARGGARRMSDVWSRACRGVPHRARSTPRATTSTSIVAWCEPGDGVTVLDVATGGGHVARRLREAGCSVVTVDPAPGMKPDVIGPAEDLPFADSSFDAVACRLAAHHFADVVAALKEMTRVAARPRGRLRQHLRQRVLRGGRPRPRPEPRPQLRAWPSGRASSSSPGSRWPRSSTWSGRSRSSRGSRAPAAPARTPRASASCSASASPTAGCRCRRS